MNRIVIKVCGKNTKLFIQKLIKENIELLNIEYINYKEINIEIYSYELKKILKLKSIYEISITKYKGLLKLKRIIKKNKIFIITLLISFMLVIFLSNLIFEVRIVHNNNELVNILEQELSNYDIKKYKLKQSYNKLNIIKKEILKKYKNKIEWLEIIESGTTYIVRVEERKIIDNKINKNYQNIVAKKDAIIKKIVSSKGAIVKSLNDYVKKGDVIISSNILLNEVVKDRVVADGTIYGEVWYEITIEYPLHYKEEKIIGTKNIITPTIFNRNILFNKNSIYINKILYKNNYFPFSINYQVQHEIEYIDEIYSLDEAINKAISLGRSKLNSKLNNDEYIIMEKQLKIDLKNSKIVIDMFYSVYENITKIEIVE